MKNIIILTSLLLCFVLSSCGLDSKNFRENSKFTLLSDSSNPAVIQDAKVSPDGVQAFYVVFKENKYFATGSIADSLQIGSRVNLFEFKVWNGIPNEKLYYITKKK
jgi:hypothetical protein